jgi:hypothetical protein
MRVSRGAHTTTSRHSFLVSLGADTQNYDGAHRKEGGMGKQLGETASLHRFVHYLCGGGVRLN